jgi:hypothetical protein
MSVSTLFGERMGKRGGITFQCFATRAIGQGAERGGDMSCGGGCGSQNASECTATRRSLRQEFDARGRQQLAGPVGGSLTTLSTAVARTRFPSA